MSVVGFEVISESPSVSGGSFLPPADNLFDLGSVAYSWRNLYVDTIIYATSVAGNWSPSADDTYYLGTATYGWKGLHLPDTLIVDDTGVVKLRNNADNAYVNLQIARLILEDQTKHIDGDTTILAATDHSSGLTYVSEVIDDLGTLVTSQEYKAGYFRYNVKSTTPSNPTAEITGLEGVAASYIADEALTFRGGYFRTYIDASATATMRTAIGCEMSARASYSGSTECVAESGTAFVGARIWMAPYFSAASVGNLNNFWGLWIYGEHATQRNADAAIKVSDAGGGFTTGLDLSTATLTYAAQFGTGIITSSPNRPTDDYAYGVKIDSDTFFSGGAAQKSYMLGVFGDRDAAYAATGDSNDALIRASGSNYAANDTNFVFRGININLTNRSGGILGRIDHNLGVQNKSGGTINNLLGLMVTAENYGTVSDMFGGLDVLLKNEAAVATTEFGIRIRNENNSIAGTVDSAILITDTGANTGWTSLIKTSPQADGDINIVYLGVTGTPKLWWDESEDRFALTKGLIIDENDILLDHDLGTTQHYSGITCLGTGGEAIAVGEIVYLEDTDDEWHKAQANAAATGTMLLGICLVAAGDGEATTILLQGFYRDDTAFDFGTAGQPLYLSDTAAGDLIATAPDTSGDIVRVVAYAHDDADTIYFNPDGAWVEVA